MSAVLARDARNIVHLPPRSDTVDHYLETIHCIAAEGEMVRPGRIADWLDVSAPTVTVALQRLARDGWVEIANDRSVALTGLGEAAAAEVIRRHRVLERWLTDVLGFDWATADVEAHRLSGGISNEVLARLDASLGTPATCPHGNAIPGRTPPYGELVALADLEPDVTATVQRISEVAEHEAPQLLQLLAREDVHIGSAVRVCRAGGMRGTLEVSVGNRTIELDISIARRIWVEAGG